MWISLHIYKVYLIQFQVHFLKWISIKYKYIIFNNMYISLHIYQVQVYSIQFQVHFIH